MNSEIRAKSLECCKQNYRSISLLNSLSKILEKIIHKRLYRFLDTNKLLHDYQCGFRPKRSTTDTISMFLGELVNNIKNELYNI